MMEIYKPFIFALSISLLATMAQAGVPSEMEIAQWLENEEPDGRKIQIEEIYPVILAGGENAYLAAVDFEVDELHSSRGYVLARPKLPAARILKDFGGQTNTVVPYGNPSPLVIIGNAGSGQGTSENTQYVVSFDGWNVKTLYSVEDSDNFGDCGYDDRPCEGNTHFFNFTRFGIARGNVGLVVTEVYYFSKQADDPSPKVTSTAKIISLARPK
jgi:hypothetical protein